MSDIGRIFDCGSSPRPMVRYMGREVVIMPYYWLAGLIVSMVVSLLVYAACLYAFKLIKRLMERKKKGLPVQK